MTQVNTTPSLLLAAFPPELAGLDQDPPPGWQVACTGVGALTAAAATARLLCTLQPSRVLFVGTCGAYDERLAVGDLIEATEALSVSLDELEGRAYRPPIERVRWPATLALPKALGLPAHTVAVPMVITKTVEGAKRLAMHAAAEHLELTGVFAACHGAGVPCGAVLAVADHVGPEAHREWKANNKQVSKALIETLKAKGVFERE
jgi:purine-nucleoside phosphorylase